MCFSPQGDVAGGIVVSAIGVDACRHLRGRRSHLLLATTPLVLGLHQIDESLVWWSLDGDLSRSVGRVAMWIYLVIALVVVPVLIPLAIWHLAPSRRRRLVLAPFVVLGVVVAAVLGAAMLRDPVTVRRGSFHLAYGIGLHHGIVIIGLYIVATCGALLFSGYRHVFVFGVANLAAVIVLARLTADGFASLWCFYAALASGAILLHLRFAKPHRHRPYALT